jgi:hypothetical protein
VTLGQHLLSELMQTEGKETATARVRPTNWESVLGLQALQREDLLDRFLDKQRRVAHLLGAELPEDDQQVQELLSKSEAGPRDTSDVAASPPSAARN